MTNLLQIGVAWLADQLAASASVEITYTRGAGSVVFNATPGATDWAAMSEYVLVNAWVSRDFIFHASELEDLPVSSPLQGDTIAEVGADGVMRTYEVLAPSGAQHFRLMGPGRDLLRVHTKLISEA